MRRPQNQTQSRPPINYGRQKRHLISNDFLKLMIIILAALFVLLLVTFFILKAVNNDSGESNMPKETEPPTESVGQTPPSEENPSATVKRWQKNPLDEVGFSLSADTGTVALKSSDIYSNYILMIDAETGRIVCQFESEERMYPASMTKVMTVIVACDLIEDMDSTFTLTDEIINPLVVENASRAEFKVGEPIPMIDLIYGAMLPSGADATAAIAISLAGSEENFVELMNQKAAELGCTNTHFTNVSGLHDKNHYSTARDMAVIMAYAVHNTFLKEVMSSETYTPSAPLTSGGTKLRSTWKGQQGSYVSNKATILAAKTGYTEEAGNCLASLSRGSDGREYIIISAGAFRTDEISGKNQTFADVQKLCDRFIK